MTGYDIAMAGLLSFGQVIPSAQKEIVKHSGLQLIHADGAVTPRLKETGREERAVEGVEFLSASCYKRVKDSTTYVQEALPCVFHSEWRAKDGRKAAILVNWTREEQQYELDFEGVKRTGTLVPLSWKAESL